MTISTEFEAKLKKAVAGTDNATQPLSKDQATQALIRGLDLIKAASNGRFEFTERNGGIETSLKDISLINISRDGIVVSPQKTHEKETKANFDAAAAAQPGYYYNNRIRITDPKTDDICKLAARAADSAQVGQQAPAKKSAPRPA